MFLKNKDWIGGCAKRLNPTVAKDAFISEREKKGEGAGALIKSSASPSCPVGRTNEKPEKILINRWV